MADIELVIKIPEEMYKWVNDVNRFFEDYGISDFIDLVKNGTPLPKGHGDLKDMNDLCYKSRYGCKSNCDYLHTCNLYGAPTIIEADNESEEA